MLKPSIHMKIILVMLVFGYIISCQNESMNRMPLLATYDFDDGKAIGWQPNIPEHWQVVDEEGLLAYKLVSPGEHGKIRAPTSWSVLAEHDVTSFLFMGRFKCNADAANKNRDLCIFFHYQDPTHFYYVHFSAISDEAHNIIGLVNGADRVKISVEQAGESIARLIDTEWHEFKVTCDVSTGEIRAYIDDMNTPILTTCDITLGHGLVGVGSFDDTGYFDDIKLWGKKTAEQ